MNHGPLQPPTVGRVRWAAVGAAVAVSLGAGGFAVTHVATAGTSSGERDVFVPITPCRLFDTRASATVGPRNTPLGPADTMTQSVTGVNGNCTLPLDAAGVAMNVTTVNGTAASFLTVWPADVTQPLASSLNWVAGSPPTPNKVDVKLSAAGKINLFNNGGTVDVLADVVGYYIDHDHSDLYYTKTEIAGLLAAIPTTTPAGPTVESIQIAGPAFQAADVNTKVYTQSNAGCRHVSSATAGQVRLDAALDLNTGVVVTQINVTLFNDSFVGNNIGGTVQLIRRTDSTGVVLATASTVGLAPGLRVATAQLAVPEVVASGASYFLRYAATDTAMGTNAAICGAQVSYVDPG